MKRSAVSKLWNVALTIILMPVRLLDFLLHFGQLGILEVLHVRRDANRPELVHLWYSRTLSSSRYGAGLNDNVRMFGHIAIDTSTWKCIGGERQRGVELHLDSPFAERSIAAIGRRLGCSTALGSSAKRLADCPVKVAKGKPDATALPEGPALLVNTWEFDGGSDSASGDVDELRYVVRSKVRWRMTGQSRWMGREHCYAGLDGTAWILYNGVDLRIRAWRLADGEVLADRYVIGGIL